MPRGPNGGEALCAEEISELAKERLRTRVRRRKGCLLWQGAATPLGYGQLSIGKGRVVSAHRAAYALAHGRVEAGVVVRHICDTTLCIEITHLDTGTQAQNMRDYIERDPRNIPRARRIRAQFAKGATVPQLMSRFHLGRHAVTDILTNRTYTDPDYMPGLYVRDRRLYLKIKLDQERLDWAREQHDQGRSYNSLAKELGVSFSTVWEALNGRCARSRGS